PEVRSLQITRVASHTEIPIDRKQTHARAIPLRRDGVSDPEGRVDPEGITGVWPFSVSSSIPTGDGVRGMGGVEVAGRQRRPGSLAQEHRTTCQTFYWDRTYLGRENVGSDPDAGFAVA